jgi:hypothetical protein
MMSLPQSIKCEFSDLYPGIWVRTIAFTMARAKDSKARAAGRMGVPLAPWHQAMRSSALFAGSSAVRPPILGLGIVARGLFVRNLLGESLRSQSSRLIPHGLSCLFFISFGELCKGWGSRGWHVRQCSDQAQQYLLFRPISLPQKLAQLDVRHLPARRSVGLVNDECMACCRPAAEGPRVPVWATVELSPVRHKSSDLGQASRSGDVVADIWSVMTACLALLLWEILAHATKFLRAFQESVLPALALFFCGRRIAEPVEFLSSQCTRLRGTFVRPDLQRLTGPKSKRLLQNRADGLWPRSRLAPLGDPVVEMLKLFGLKPNIDGKSGACCLRAAPLAFFGATNWPLHCSQVPQGRAGQQRCGHGRQQGSMKPARRGPVRACATTFLRCSNVHSSRSRSGPSGQRRSVSTWA